MSKIIFKPITVIAVAPIILASGYLLFAYGQFYNTIGEKNLQSPYNQKQFVLENPQKEGAVKYVALGDSLTAGVGSDDVESTFVYQVAKKFSDQYGKVEVVNLGVPGATSQDLIVDQLPQVVQDLDNVTDDGSLTNETQHITLLIGINDIHNKVSVQDYKDRLSLIVDELLAKTNAHIALINLPYLGAPDVVSFPLNKVLDRRTREFNNVVEEVGQIKGQSGRLKVVDLYIQTRQPPYDDAKYYASDHFHPSGEGYLLWGKIINAD